MTTKAPDAMKPSPTEEEIRARHQMCIDEGEFGLPDPRRQTAGLAAHHDRAALLSMLDGRDAVIEECARVADGLITGNLLSCDDALGTVSDAAKRAAWGAVARDIRALKSAAIAPGVVTKEHLGGWLHDIFSERTKQWNELHAAAQSYWIEKADAIMALCALQIRYLTRIVSSDPRTPNAWRSHRQTTKTTTTLIMLLIFGSMGMSVLTKYSNTPTTIKTAIRPTSDMVQLLQ